MNPTGVIAPCSTPALLPQPVNVTTVNTGPANPLRSDRAVRAEGGALACARAASRLPRNEAAPPSIPSLQPLVVDARSRSSPGSLPRQPDVALGPLRMSEISTEPDRRPPASRRDVGVVVSEPTPMNRGAGGDVGCGAGCGRDVGCGDRDERVVRAMMNGVLESPFNVVPIIAVRGAGAGAALLRAGNSPVFSWPCRSPFTHGAQGGVGYHPRGDVVTWR